MVPKWSTLGEVKWTKTQGKQSFFELSGSSKRTSIIGNVTTGKLVRLAAVTVDEQGKVLEAVVSR